MDPRTAAAAAAAPRLLPHLLPHLLHLHVHLHLHPRLLFLLLLLLSGLFASDATSLGEFDTECYTANGEDYRGVQNRTASTASGKACLYWNETFQHPYNTVKYPNGEGGLGPHNYCRNPDGDVQPWCYIADHEDGIYWRYCDISTCQMPGNLGCFRDSGDPPALSGPSDTSNKLTIQNCISFCRKQRYKLAGMESGYACFCGNEVDQRSRADSPGTECNHVCFGDHTQPCGGDGWIIVFDTQVGSCGGNYTSSSGVLYSPDFPDRYGAGRACYWTVQVAGAAALLFHFSFFDLADQTDMVELLDGSGSPSGQVVARFDRRSPPPLREGEGSEVKVDGDFAIVYFYSDRTNQARGFSLRYRALKGQDSTTIDDDEDDDDGDSKVDSDVSSTAGPQLSNRGSTSTTTSSSSSQRSNGSTAERRSVLHVMTSSPRRPEQDTAVWSIYALAALLVLTVVALVAKLLLHVSIKTPTIPTVSGSFSSTSNSSSSSSSEPWIILYRPSTISLFKEKLRSHHSDLSPLVGN